MEFQTIHHKSKAHIKGLSSTSSSSTQHAALSTRVKLFPVLPSSWIRLQCVYIFSEKKEMHTALPNALS